MQPGGSHSVTSLRERRFGELLRSALPLEAAKRANHHGLLLKPTVSLSKATAVIIKMLTSIDTT
jgi:hypothetical protein